jgi:methionine-rich copper-binding protein CopC
MQLKQLGVTLALAGMLSTQAYAHEAVTEAAPLAAAAAQEAPANVLTQDDLVALFGAEEAGKPVQLALLSQQEMRETEGAFAFAPVFWFLGRVALGVFNPLTMPKAWGWRR